MTALPVTIFCPYFVFQVGYNHWTTRVQEEARLGNQIGVDLCTEIRRWTLVQYPLVSDIGSVQDACSSHLEQYPHAPPPFLGPAHFQHCWPDFEEQDQWNELMLRQQQDRFSVHVDRERFYEVHGLGLPFERLYFQAREQLVHATNELGRLRGERLREKADEFARTQRRRSI